MTPEHLKPLTSLRFFAAAWVVLFHYWPKLAVDFTPALVSKGYLGVELFFVLSGFILCHVYLASAGEKQFDYGGFLWARLARVYPLHLATLLGVGLLAGAATLAGFGIDASVLSWESLPANLLMVHAWGLAPEAGWNHPSWSISAEWFAYLTFPLFAWAAWRLRARPVTAVVAGSALLFVTYAAFERLAGFSLTQATIAWGALRIVPCFAFGCAVYLAWKAGAANRPPVAAAGAVASLGGILFAAGFGAGDAVTVSLFGFLILSLAGMASAGSKFLTAAPFVWLGEVSYSVYMVCVPWKLLAINAAAKLLGLQTEQLPWPVWLAVVLSIVPLAGLSHHLIEKPTRERMRAMAERRRAAGAAPALA